MVWSEIRQGFKKQTNKQKEKKLAAHPQGNFGKYSSFRQDSVLITFPLRPGYDDNFSHQKKQFIIFGNRARLVDLQINARVSRKRNKRRLKNKSLFPSGRAHCVNTVSIYT